MSRRYLPDFNAAVASTATATELYAKMLASYPDRVTRGAPRQRDGKNAEPGVGLRVPRATARNCSADPP